MAVLDKDEEAEEEDGVGEEVEQVGVDAVQRVPREERSEGGTGLWRGESDKQLGQ